MELVLEGAPRSAGRRILPFPRCTVSSAWGLGAIIRATAGAITLLVVWPADRREHHQRVLPQGRALAAVHGRLSAHEHVHTFDAAEALTPRAGGLLFALFALVLLLVGSTLVVRRRLTHVREDGAMRITLPSGTEAELARPSAAQDEAPPPAS